MALPFFIFSTGRGSCLCFPDSGMFIVSQRREDSLVRYGVVSITLGYLRVLPPRVSRSPIIHQRVCLGFLPCLLNSAVPDIAAWENTLCLGLPLTLCHLKPPWFFLQHSSWQKNGLLQKRGGALQSWHSFIGIYRAQRGLGGSAVPTQFSSKELSGINQQDLMQHLAFSPGPGTHLEL